MGLADCIIILYAMGSLGGVLGLFRRFSSMRKPAAWAIAAGFFLHTFAVFCIVAFTEMETVSKSALLELMAWSLVLVYCVTWWRLRFAFLGITAGPLALALYMLSTTVRDVQGGLPSDMTGIFVVLHLVVLFLNLALITLGLGSAFYFLNLHRKLKSKAILSEVEGNSPALATVDRVNRFVIIAGFPLFTVGLVTGFAWAHFARGAVVSSDPKEVVSILLWLFYAFIFLQRTTFGWQGRRAAIMLIVLFLAMVLSLVGVNFFTNSHHSIFKTGIF